MSERSQHFLTAAAGATALQQVARTWQHAHWSRSCPWEEPSALLVGRWLSATRHCHLVALGRQWREDPGPEEPYRAPPPSGRDRGLPSSVWASGGTRKERNKMARECQGADEWQTILWIAWRAGETERLEPLCRAHREHVFKHYPNSAHGVGRSGDQCAMCRSQQLRTAQFPGPRAGTVASRESKSAPPRGQGTRRRISPIRHGASFSPPSGQE
jgi:hypothetical protein